MKIWLFIYYFTISIFLINKIGTVNKKVQKSFAEIFGEGWEEKEKKANANLENGHGGDQQKDGIGQCLTKVLQKDKNKTNLNKYSDQQRQEIIRKFRTIKKTIKQKRGKYSKKEWVNFEAKIAKKLGTNRIYIYKWIKEFGMGRRKSEFDVQQKEEIIHKFRTIKEKIKQKGIKYSKKEWVNFEGILAKKLGTNRIYIYKWIKEFGMGRRKSEFDVQQKEEIIHKFHTIKEKIKQKGIKYSKKEWVKIEETIAYKLGTNRSEIYKWKKEFARGDRKIILTDFSDDKKREIVKKFIKINNEYKQNGRYSAKEWGKKYAKILKRNGISNWTIKRWKREFGMGRERKCYRDEEKLVILEQYRGMKRKNPQMSETKIAKTMKIDRRNLNRWKANFKEIE